MACTYRHLSARGNSRALFVIAFWDQNKLIMEIIARAFRNVNCFSDLFDFRLFQQNTKTQTRIICEILSYN